MGENTRLLGPYSTMTQIDDASAVQTANASSIWVDGWECVSIIGVVCGVVCTMEAASLSALLSLVIYEGEHAVIGAILDHDSD